MLLLLVVTILLTTTSFAFQNVTLHGECSADCDVSIASQQKVNLTWNDFRNDDLSIFFDPNRQPEYFYAIDDDCNASFPVMEYCVPEVQSDVTLSDPEQLRAFLQISQTNQVDRYRHFIILVIYYKPYCEACKTIKEVFIKLALFLRVVFLENTLEDDVMNNSFESFAINCVRYSHLCSTIQSYPSIRVYNMNDGSTVDISHKYLHPYSILHKLGFDEVTTHSVIHKMARRTKLQSDATTIKSLNYANGDYLNELKQQLDYIYNEKKQVDLGQDLHASVDTMFRHYIYIPKNVNMTTSRNIRDPPLKLSSAHALGVLLELVIRIISPVNPHLERLHNMMKELAANFIYVTNHAGYLPVILDEFRISVPTASNSRRSRKSRYSQECSPRKRIMTPNDDELSNNESNIFEEEYSYRCGLWKFLFYMIVSGGLTEYNAVALRNEDFISAYNWISILQDYARDVGFGIWTDQDLHILENTRLRNETGDGVEESPEMQLALWLGTVRNEMQVHEMIQNRKVLFPRDSVEEADVLSMQWPLRQACSSCWTNVPRSEKPLRQEKNYLFDRPVLWNDGAVYKYIKLEYGIPPDSLDELLRLYLDVYPDDEANEGYRVKEHSDEL
jgi:thiol-disulfide isomerase/thioredoxin